jgi:hypothetical protein
MVSLVDNATRERETRPAATRLLRHSRSRQAKMSSSACYVSCRQVLRGLVVIGGEQIVKGGPAMGAAVPSLI